MVIVPFMFWQLLSGKFKRTQTSITDSSAPYKAKNDRVSSVYDELSSLVSWWTWFTFVPLSLLYSGQHLDSDRPARTWQSSLSVPGEVQVCSQVRTSLSNMCTLLSAQLPHPHSPVSHLFRAIVFVVDSGIFQKEVRDVAEFLYILLTDTVISRNAPALLVACNKQG